MSEPKHAPRSPALPVPLPAWLLVPAAEPTIPPVPVGAEPADVIEPPSPTLPPRFALPDPLMASALPLAPPSPCVEEREAAPPHESAPSNTSVDQEARAIVISSLPEFPEARQCMLRG